MSTVNSSVLFVAVTTCSGRQGKIYRALSKKPFSLNQVEMLHPFLHLLAFIFDDLSCAALNPLIQDTDFECLEWLLNEFAYCLLVVIRIT